MANDVAASTAQLVAASRVKASFMSKSQERLESASKAVTGACRSLVKQVQEIIATKNNDENETIDYSKLSGYEIKVQEMEQQVCQFLSLYLVPLKLTVLSPGRNQTAREPAATGTFQTWRDEEALVCSGPRLIGFFVERRGMWFYGRFETMCCILMQQISSSPRCGTFFYLFSYNYTFQIILLLCTVVRIFLHGSSFFLAKCEYLSRPYTMGRLIY